MAIELFDKTDPASVLEHARKLKRLTVAEVAERLGRPELAERAGKGRIGHVIEMWFGIEYDNESEPDLRETAFEGSAYSGLEIKIVPIRRKPQDGSYGVKERNVVSMISYHSLPEETWPMAKVRKKLEHMLFVYYLYEGGDDWMSSRVLDVHLWSFADIVDQEQRTIHDDWTLIRDKVARGDAHDLHERDTLILKANRKGAGGAEKPRDYAAGAQPAYARSFSISRGHMDVVWQRDVLGKDLVQVAPRGETFEEVVMGKLRALEGKRLKDIDPAQNWSAKSAASSVIRAALGAEPGKIKEFVENEITVRVVPIFADTGMPKEAVSFPTMKLREFVDENWDNATLRDYITCVLFVPMLHPKRKTETADCIVGRAFFWRPDEEEELGIEREWKAYQEQVKRGACRTMVDAQGHNRSSLVGSKDTKYIHMRPHGRDGTDLDFDAFGNPIVKQSFWLNQRFVKALYLRST